LAHNFLYALTLLNINRFSKLFYCQNQKKICNNVVIKDPTTPKVCRYTALCNISDSKATITNNTYSVTIQEINNGKQRVYFLSYCLKYALSVTSCRFYIKFNVSALLHGRHTQAGDATDQCFQLLLIKTLTFHKVV